MATAMRPTLPGLVSRHSVSLGAAIDAVWPNSNLAARQYTEWKFLEYPHTLWVTAVVQSMENTRTQVVHYHLLEGHLLIDGCPMGKLPSDVRDSQVLKELFGNQRLIAFPSNMAGMDYVLATEKAGHLIHLGRRKQQLVIRAQKSTKIFELIPRGIFEGRSSFDLPSSLIDGCVHWLDLYTGILEIRPKTRIWKESAWTVNISTRKGLRRQAGLVDPQSDLFKLVAQIFQHFEDPRMLTVVQPFSRPLTVELKRMDLTFYVNRKNLLQCKQLGAEVDPNQDASTLYGLQSMLVLRNSFNRMQRSIVTTMGKLHYKRYGMHVIVRMENDGDYARYIIDNVLGQLQSPPEPRLLYLKALLHALTSSFVPDLLTGRTGTEEALACLQSGRCQPWKPISLKDEMPALVRLSSLSPFREYYPESRKFQQKVKWDCNLTTTIQHDAFYPVIGSILEKSERLSRFEPGGMGQDKRLLSSPHLQKRALWRRLVYERPGILSAEPASPPDITYAARDRWLSSKRTSNVREIVSLINERPTAICTTKNLPELLGKWPVIGGYIERFRSGFLREYLDIDLSHHWGGIVMLCRDSEPEDVYDLMFHLGLLAFQNDVDMTPMRVVVAFYLFDDLKHMEYPIFEGPFTGFKANVSVTTHTLLKLVKAFALPYQYEAPGKGSQKRGLTLEEAIRHQNGRSEHDRNSTEECRRFAAFLADQWPNPEPSANGFQSDYIDKRQAIEAILPEWVRRFRNYRLSQHIENVQNVLNRHWTDNNIAPAARTPANLATFSRETRQNYTLPRLEDLIRHPGPEVNALQSQNDAGGWGEDRSVASHKLSTKQEIEELECIVGNLLDSNCPVTRRYGQDLSESIAALKMTKQPSGQETRREVSFGQSITRLNAGINTAKTIADQQRTQITRSMSFGNLAFAWLHRGNLWPCVMPAALLQQLRSTSCSVFGPNMKDALTSYGLAIVELQRQIRMKEAFGRGDLERLRQEHENRGHVNWNPSAFPDWLLLEIDSNIQIREEQVTVALEMISPSSGSNSVLQLTMGKGKTSVIMPMVASVLANGAMLTRILVPKALLTQAAMILQARLGGLLGRELSHIPFSRRTPTALELLAEYRTLHSDILNRSGIILGIPDHILSFKLCGLQRVSDDKLREAADMIAIQDWMNHVSRDILDECDFTLAVKTQLIYPSGSQLQVDGHPDRWEVTMAILSLVSRHLPDLAHGFPRSIDVIERASSAFPVVYFLRNDVERALVQQVVDSICSGQTPVLPVQCCTLQEMQAIRQFISQKKIDPIIINRISKLFQDRPNARKIIYLLRGLLVHGILLLCLKKRWNVQYGLHPFRDPVAVPFNAKGVPSEHSEWGHPDVAIVFTCLAFYYDGLSEKQLRQSLQLVLKSDDPAVEYEKWIQASTTLPEPLHHWNVINIDDSGQITEIWRHTRLAIVVINHFLRNFVFPLHARQFEVKIQASGWDVPLFSNSSTVTPTNVSKRPGITTGFSGTNDNRRLLPLTITQQDLPELSHTNAEVLTYLLQRRNRGYQLATDSTGRRLSEIDLLRHLTQHKISILIDAGAYILEMDNYTLARTWLQEDENAQAAVYFGSENKAWVLYANGRRVPLLATPFAENMTNCVVYLDEAHTRGTDLKLPLNARGALTLALNQTKDHTVQAAMRLRQLSTTQSVTFIAPPEVHQSILDACRKRANDRIDSSDVIVWLLNQTCASNRALQPLYFAQGNDFCNRMQAAKTYNNFLTSSQHRTAYLGHLEQSEAQTVQGLYDPKMRNDSDEDMASDTSSLVLKGTLWEFKEELKQNMTKSNLTSGLLESSTLEEVEQEREVAFEIEEERQLERPRQLTALKFLELRESLVTFAKTGVLDRSDGYKKASVLLESTQLGLKYNIKGSSVVSHLWVSPEFSRTVKLKPGEKNDGVTRPVQWIMFSPTTEEAVVIIPEEAELLIPIVRSTESMVHLILYAAPVTRKMVKFNHLDYYSLPTVTKGWTPPAWLPFELGILAGRLYFNFSEYTEILQRLGLSPENSSGSYSAKNGHNSAYLRFLQEWLVLCRQGQDISHTPMGYVLQGLTLRPDHPFFLTRQVGEQTPNVSGQAFNLTTYTTRDEVEDDDEPYYESDGDDDGDFMHVDEDEKDEECEVDDEV